MSPNAAISAPRVRGAQRVFCPFERGHNRFAADLRHHLLPVKARARRARRPIRTPSPCLSARIRAFKVFSASANESGASPIASAHPRAWQPHGREARRERGRPGNRRPHIDVDAPGAVDLPPPDRQIVSITGRGLGGVIDIRRRACQPPEISGGRDISRARFPGKLGLRKWRRWTRPQTLDRRARLGHQRQRIRGKKLKKESRMPFSMAVRANSRSVSTRLRSASSRLGAGCPAGSNASTATPIANSFDMPIPHKRFHHELHEGHGRSG